MIHSITSTKPDVAVAFDRMTDALVAAQQLVKPGAVDEACALILGAFEGDDARFRVPLAYARSAAAGLVTWSSELRLSGDRLFTALDTWFICAGFRPAPMPSRSHHRQHGSRKPSIATLIKRAEKAGRPVTSITMPDGTTLHFGEAEPSEANNPWLADLHKETKQ